MDPLYKLIKEAVNPEIQIQESSDDHKVYRGLHTFHALHTVAAAYSSMGRHNKATDVTKEAHDHYNSALAEHEARGGRENDSNWNHLYQTAERHHKKDLVSPRPNQVA